MTVTETTTEAGPVETAAPPARGLRPGRMELDRLATRVAVGPDRPQHKVTSPLTGEVLGDQLL